MQQYDPKRHHRKSIRLKGYDYSQAGLYFVTICCQNRTYLFGEIINREMMLNDAGQMIEKWYCELENKFLDIKCREMIVMPNHIHFIIQNDPSVGTDLRVCPSNEPVPCRPIVPERPVVPVAPNEHANTMGEHTLGENTLGEHVGSPLHRVMQWFKTMTTNEYIRGVKNNNWQSFDGKLWQRNYYEHIIRNDNAYQKISEYIINNPSKWTEDNLNNR